MKAWAKHRRAAKLGGGSKADSELRKAVAALALALPKAASRRQRPRLLERADQGAKAKPGGQGLLGDPSKGLIGGDAEAAAGPGAGPAAGPGASRLVLGLLGDLAWLPAAEAGLAHAIGAHLGPTLMRFGRLVLNKQLSLSVTSISGTTYVFIQNRAFTK